MQSPKPIYFLATGSLLEAGIENTANRTVFILPIKPGDAENHKE